MYILLTTVLLFLNCVIAVDLCAVTLPLYRVEAADGAVPPLAFVMQQVLHYSFVTAYGIFLLQATGYVLMTPFDALSFEKFVTTYCFLLLIGLIWTTFDIGNDEHIHLSLTCMMQRSL